MPKSTDPTLIASSQNQSATGAGEILRAQLNKQFGVYTSTQIYDGQDPQFFGTDLASKIDQLTGSLPAEIGKLGSLTLGSTSNPEGIVDWGLFKQADGPVWNRADNVGSTSSDYYKNQASEAYPYFADFKPSAGSDGSLYRSDALFNVGFSEDIPSPSSSLPGGGPGEAHLGSTYKTGPLNDEREIRPINLVYDSMGTLEGMTLSGILYPADRGTVALLRVEEGQTDWLSPSTTAEEVMSKVVAAINIGAGAESALDGQRGGLFVAGDRDTFPSAYNGQYDLSEIQRATYRADHPDVGGDPIPDMTASPHAGSVRLLRDPSALGGETHPGGNLPVLFGTEMWDFDTENFFNYTGEAEEDLNFLAYRLPRLPSYEAGSLTTPVAEKGRFFLPIRPNSLAEGAYLSTAGGYASYGETSYSDQIARYRYTVKYKQMKAGLEADATSATFGSNHYSIGSFVLVHFKTEEAFERLVRDGELPTDEDLWSVNAVGIDYNMESTTELSEYSTLNEYGLSSALGRFIETGAQGSALQNAKVVTAESKYSFSLTKTYQQVTSIGSTDCRYTVISGVYYLLPRTQGFFNANSLVYGEAKEEGENIASLSLGMAIRLQESFPPTNGNGSTLNWTLPFYTYSTEASTRSELTDDPIYTYKTLPTGRILFNHASSGQAVRLIGESAPSELAWFLDSDFTSERFKQGAFDLEYSLFSNATDRDEVRSPHEVVFGLRGFYPLGDGGLETERPPVFTKDYRVSFALFNPAKHRSDIGLEIAQDTSYMDGGAFSGPLYGDPLLYHSARMKSLLQDCSLDTVNLIASFSALPKDALAFYIYRLDGGGDYAIFQTLNVNGTIFELCSGEANPYGGTYPSDVPVYRPVDDLGYNSGAVGITFDAVLNYDVKTHVPGGLGYDPTYPAYDSYFFKFANRAEINLGDFTVKVDGYDHTDPSTYFNVVGDVNPTFGVNVEYGIDFKTGFSGLLEGAEYLDTSAWGQQIDSGIMALAVEIYDTEDDEMSHYGNFSQTDSGAISIAPSPSPSLLPYMGGFDQRKDTSERFLDEMYRMSCSFLGFSETVTSDQGNDLTLSDLLSYGNVIEHNSAPQTWSSALDYTFSVRDSYFLYLDFDPILLETANHRSSGWVRNGYNLSPVTARVTYPEAQVSGVPYISNNNATSAYASLSRGMMVVPEESFDSDYRPSALSGDSVAQPDYVDGNTNIYPTASNGDLYSYMRMFDVSFGYLETVTTEFTIRLIGISYAELNPDLTSSEDNTSIPLGDASAPLFSVLIQVPAKTAWLNIARPEEENKAGGGTTGFVTYPGCMISYEDKVLVKEAVRCVDIRVSTAPYTIEAYGSYYPILVKANVNKTDSFTTPNMDSFDPASPYLTRKGLLGIEILKESTGKNYDGDDTLPISDYGDLSVAL